jgi:hypothetical protein
MADPDYNFTTNLRKFYEVKSVKDFSVKVGENKAIPVVAVFGDGHTEDITNEVTITSDNLSIVDNKLASNVEAEGTASVDYTDFTRKQATYTFNLAASYFPLDADNVVQISGTATFNPSNHALKFNALAMAGWTYSSNIDLSGYKYLVVKLKQRQSFGAEIRISSSTNTTTVGFRDTINDRTIVAVDLHNMKYSNNTKVLDPAKIRMVAFRAPKAGTMYIDKVFLTNDDEYAMYVSAISDIEYEPMAQEGRVYDLTGRRMKGEALNKGIYIRNKKKYIQRE